jgi:hypothetical protein
MELKFGLLLFSLLLPPGISLGYRLAGWILAAPSAFFRGSAAAWEFTDRQLLQRFFPARFETYRLDPYAIKYFRVFGQVCEGRL